MTAKNYDAALEKVLIHEGGYSNHPQDPGGATNKGVTQRVYDLYRTSKGMAKRSVKSITRPEITDIYRTRYWNEVQGDKLPAGVDYVVFDGAVNSGPGQSVKWLQRALRPAYSGSIDGRLGPSTLKAVRDHQNHDKLIALILGRRLAFLEALKTWPTFGKGWKARVAGVKAVGQAWATGAEAPPIEYVDGGDAKGLIEDAKQPPSAAPGDAAAGGGGFGALISGYIDQLTPYTSIDFIGTAVAVLAVASVVALAAGGAWRWYANRRKAALDEALDTAKPT